MPGEILWYVKTPSPDNQHPATWGIKDHNDADVDISASVTCGFQEWLNLCKATGFPGRAMGGPGMGADAPAGVNPSMAFLQVPVDVPTMYLGAIELFGVSLIAAHLGAYVVRLDSFMSSTWRHEGGQIVLNPAAWGQCGFLIQPRNKLPVDPNGPVVGQTEITLPSIVGAQGSQRGNGQVLCHIDGTYAPVSAVRLQLIEPNGGDYGFATTYGAHGYDTLEVDIVAAHQQYYSAVDLGHGAAAPTGTMLRLNVRTGNYSVASQMVDTWETGGIYEIMSAIENGMPTRSMTFEAPSKNCRVTVGGPVAALAPVVAAGSGPNWVNGVQYP